MSDSPQEDSPSKDQVDRVLQSIKGQDASAMEHLLPLVYGELRGLARSIFSGESSQHTLQPTALVHEVFLKLSGKMDGIENRAHFFAIAGRAMRQVLTDHARAKKSLKRGSQYNQVELDPNLMAKTAAGFDWLSLEESLGRLEKVHPRHAQVMELRILGGLTLEETAQVTGSSLRTTASDWALAREWLRADLGGE